MTNGHDDRVRDRAYHLWQASGGAHGQEMQHWLQAEQDVAAEERRPAATPKKAPARDAAPKPVTRKPAAAKAAPAKAAEPKAAKPAASKPRAARAEKPAT